MANQTRKRKNKARRRARLFRQAVLLIGGTLLVIVLLAGMTSGWFRHGDALDALPSDVIDDGTVRVYLKSLGRPEALGLTLDGIYTVEGDKGFRFARGTEISVAADEGTLLLTTGGLTIDMGQNFTLTRHAVNQGETNGLYIHESERDNLFSGDLLLSNEGNGIDAILTVQVEEYLYGVVAYEMSDSFPLEALKAQAVAARTYAMRAKQGGRSRAYDVTDTTSDQVYRGFDPTLKRVIQAVDETYGVVGMANGTYAACYYTASNGGQVASSDQAWGGTAVQYIEMKSDPYDLENSQSVEKKALIPRQPDADSAISRLLAQALSEAMAARGMSEEEADIRIDEILSVTPVDPDKEGSLMYRAMRFEVKAAGRRWLEAEAEPTPETDDQPTSSVQPTFTPEPTPAPTLPSWGAQAPQDTQEPLPTGPLMELGEFEAVEEAFCVDIPTYGALKSALNLAINSASYEVFTVREDGDGFTIIARRFGHGVGMSQRGAQTMAGKYKMSCEDILSFYYPGMALYQINWQEKELTPLASLPASVGYARPRPTPKPTLAPLPPLTGEEYYARVVLETSSSQLNVRKEPNTACAIVATLSRNDRVIVTGEAGNGWYQIKTVEFTGYVKGDYIARE